MISSLRTLVCVLLVPLILLFGGCRRQKAEAPPAPAPGITADAPPLEFLAGSYDIVGRLPESGASYVGTLVMSVSPSDPAALTIARTVASASMAATGVLAKTSEGQPVLRLSFEDAGQAMEATYLLGSDLDNYARLTGYVYRKDGRTAVPGLEALFSTHYKEKSGDDPR